MRTTAPRASHLGFGTGWLAACALLIIAAHAAPGAAQAGQDAPAQTASPAASPTPSAAPSPTQVAKSTSRPPQTGLGRLSDIGLVMFATTYLTSLGIGAFYLVACYPIQYSLAKTDPEPALLWLMVPVVGPFLGAGSEHLKDERGLRITYGVVGGLQATGLILWSLGLFDSQPASARADGVRMAGGFQLQAGVYGSPLGATLVHSL